MDLKKLILISFVLSGMAALIYEVVWTRPLQFIFGSSIYIVSIIFAAFMAGLALGSFIMSKYTDKIKNLPKAYAFLELGIGLYGVLLLFIFNILPDLYRVIYTLRGSFYTFGLAQFLLAFLVLIIPTSLMGATFPVIAKFYTEKKIGKGIGEVYSANNLGAILGSFTAGFILVPVLGIKPSLLFAASINIIIAFVILSFTSPKIAKKVILASLAVFLIFAFITNYNINQLYSGGFSRAQHSKDTMKNVEFLYYKEGLHVTVSVIKGAQGALILLFNGKGQGSTVITDLRVNFLLAYLPLLLKSDINESLVIGLGTGTTSGQLANFMKTKTLEIEPAVIDASKHFWFTNENVLENPNHELIITDGRNYLLKDKEKYDLIVPELSDPWESFSTTFYSKEFFELSKEHLKEGGLHIQWVPIYEMDPQSFKSFYRTFSSVFPHVVAFASIKEDEVLPVRHTTPEILLVGSNKEIEVSKDVIKRNFDALPLTSKHYLNQIKLDSGEKVSHLFMFSDDQMEGYAKDAPLVTDDMPLLEFATAKIAFYPDPRDVTTDIQKFLGENNAGKN